MTDHHFARDRAPIASTTIPTLWRYRWSCSCGATGRWQTTSTSLAYRGWRQHLKNLRTRGKCKA
jgi:hypothetical protein